MAFKPHTNDDGVGQPFEYFPIAGSLAVKSGTMLIMSSGKLALATGTNKPTYVCISNIAETTTGEIVAVQRVDPKTIFETTLSEADSDIAIGEKHTISADGNEITATTSSGVAEIVSFDGTDAGSKVRVRIS